MGPKIFVFISKMDSFIYLFICQNVTYNIHSKFTLQQARQTGVCTTLMSALNLDCLYFKSDNIVYTWIDFNNNIFTISCSIFVFVSVFYLGCVPSAYMLLTF